MTLQSKGTPAFEEFPKINIFIDEDKVGSFTNEKDFKKHEYIVHINDYNPVLRFEMINDAIDKETEEDRNSFISSILLERISD